MKRRTFLSLISLCLSTCPSHEPLLPLSPILGIHPPMSSSLLCSWVPHTRSRLCPVCLSDTHSLYQAPIFLTFHSTFLCSHLDGVFFVLSSCCYSAPLLICESLYCRSVCPHPIPQVLFVLLTLVFHTDPHCSFLFILHTPLPISLPPTMFLSFFTFFSTPPSLEASFPSS